MNTYVMSDIHGCYDEFQRMLTKIKFGKDDLLICAGDYIDRGTKNYEMMNWIVNAPDNVIFVRGNHDEEFVANIDIMKTICEKVGLDRYSSDDSRTLHKAVQELAKQEGIGVLYRMAGFFGQRLYFGHKTKEYSDMLCVDTDKCIGCGKCEKLCPMNNIKIVDKKVAQNNRCTMCYRRINNCPMQAMTLLGKKVVEQGMIEKYL